MPHSPSIGENKAGGWRVWVQPGLHSPDKTKTKNPKQTRIRQITVAATSLKNSKGRGDLEEGGSGKISALPRTEWETRWSTRKQKSTKQKEKLSNISVFSPENRMLFEIVSFPALEASKRAVYTLRMPYRTFIPQIGQFGMDQIMSLPNSSLRFSKNWVHFTYYFWGCNKGKKLALCIC
jgi:hypothetical protein